jgi:hypothetical protein
MPFANSRREAGRTVDARSGRVAWQFIQDVWGKPATQDDVKMRAELCAYWTGGYRDANGDLHLPDLTSKYLNERAAAELIAAVLAPNS